MNKQKECKKKLNELLILSLISRALLALGIAASLDWIMGSKNSVGYILGGALTITMILWSFVAIELSERKFQTLLSKKEEGGK